MRLWAWSHCISLCCAQWLSLGGLLFSEVHLGRRRCERVGRNGGGGRTEEREEGEEGEKGEDGEALGGVVGGETVEL